MIPQIIRDNIAAKRRISIPNLGSFLLNGDEILFLEFVDNDDDQLRTLLMERGVDEFDSISRIDEFVATVNAAMIEGGEFIIEGVGALKRSDDGTISFVGCGTQREAIIDVDSLVEEVVNILENYDTTTERTPELDSTTPKEKIEEPSTPKSPKRSTIEALYGIEKEPTTEPNKTQNEENYTPPYTPPAPPRRGGGIDILLLISFIGIAFAICLIAYSFFIQWQIGELILPEAIDNVMLKIFGDGMSGIESVVVE